VISSQSLRCRSAIPSARCRSSREVGWTSLLVDVHAGSSSTDPYTSVGTHDPRLGVTISGRYSAEYFTQAGGGTTRTVRDRSTSTGPAR
jgi:hypothetical protein